MRAWLLLLLCVPALSGAEEYFLDGSQKAELLMEGRITGRDGAQYDIWVVPGYAPPMEQVGKGWRAAGTDLAEYGKPDYFPKMLDTTRDVMRYARRDVIGRFAFRGTAEAWQESSAAAMRRTQKRVFGWWFAWPWAVIEASAESVVRVGAGVPGGVGLWGGAAVVIPAAYLAWPSVMAAGHSLGQGTLLPVSAAAWNTLVAPPLALAGQQPAPERADGWWMKRLQDPAEADIRARVARWQERWSREPALAGMREAMEADAARHRELMQQLRTRMEAEERAWVEAGEARQREYRRQTLARALAEIPALRREMAAQGYSPSRLQAQREALLQELVAQGVDPEAAGSILNAWLGLPDTTVAPDWQQTEKTDPARQVLQRLPGVTDGNP